MLNLKREQNTGSADFRKFPRIELHCPVTIIGFNTKASIIDFSLGGFYIETDCALALNQSQKVNLALKLPGEDKIVMVKCEVVYREEFGFGCKLHDPAPDIIQVLERCFTVFSSTLPME